MLKIKNITAAIKDQIVLNKINLDVKAGEIHAVIGGPQSGKSSLVHTILGNPILDIKEGSILYKKKSIIKKTVDERSLMGIFTTFQFLPILDGITNFDLLKSVIKAPKDTRNSNTIEKEYKKILKELGLSSNHGYKFVNDETMTMTECKKNEVLQAYFLNPDLLVFDEVDREVEEEELEILANSIKKLLNKKNSAIVVSQNLNFLNMLGCTHVNVIINGSICEQGDRNLLKRIETNGYTQLS
jgi:Fe-S cluster assembly ATP-binding protein